MAKVIEETIVIRLSKIVKDISPQEDTPFDQTLLDTLETVTQELIGAGWVVEASVEE